MRGRVLTGLFHHQPKLERNVQVDVKLSHGDVVHVQQILFGKSMNHQGIVFPCQLWHRVFFLTLTTGRSSRLETNNCFCLVATMVTILLFTSCITCFQNILPVATI